MIFRMNFGFHGRSFGAPAPVFKMAVGTDLGRSITQRAVQNKPRICLISICLISIFPDTYLPGFASGGGEAYLGAAKAIGQIS
jgi:hypothetical protein